MEKPRKPLFSLGGVGVVVDVSWVVIFALVLASLAVGYVPMVHPGHGPVVYWAVSTVIALLFFASVLVHELAHAWVSNRLGLPVDTVTLFLFGGVAHLSAEPQDPDSDLKIAAAGPLTSVGLGAAFAVVAWMSSLLELSELLVGASHYLAVINLLLGAFNSLPGLPLDGGRVLRSFLWRKSGDFRASTQRAAEVGRSLSTGMMVFGGLQALFGNLVGGFWLVLIGLFLRNAAETTRRGARLDRTLAGAKVGDLMVRDPVVVNADASVATAAEEFFLHHGYGGFPVVDDGRVCGLVSLRDVRRCPREERSRRSVRDVMRRDDDSIRIPADADLAVALKRMTESESSRLLVTEDDRVVGLITRSGVSRFAQMREALDPP